MRAAAAPPLHPLSSPACTPSSTASSASSRCASCQTAVLTCLQTCSNADPSDCLLFIVRQGEFAATAAVEDPVPASDDKEV